VTDDKIPPRPWRVFKRTIYDANGKPLAWISVGAEHIVHCVNAEWERTKKDDE